MSKFVIGKIYELTHPSSNTIRLLLVKRISCGGPYGCETSCPTDCLGKLDGPGVSEPVCPYSHSGAWWKNVKASEYVATFKEVTIE